MSYLQQFNILLRYKEGIANKLVDMLFRPLTHSTLFVAIQIQPLEPIEYAKDYENDTDFGHSYLKLMQGKLSEYQLRMI